MEEEQVDPELADLPALVDDDSDEEGMEVELGKIEAEDPNQGKELEGLEQEDDEAVLEGI